MPRFPFLAAALAALLAGGIATAAETPSGAGPAAPLRARVLELEAGLVKTPALYLVLDPAAGKLEVRSRGLVLDTVPVEEVRVLHYRPLLGGGRHPQPEVPGIWTVIEGPGPGVALLGMSFLNRTEIRRDGSYLTLTKRY